MSDSHDNLKAINRAVNEFNQVGVDLVVHAGDLISPFTAREFNKLQAPLEAVFGNNDGERHGLKTAYSELTVLCDFKEIKFNGREIALIHGTEEPLVEALTLSGKYDIVIRGHTHQMKITEGPTMVINPGETCGYLTDEKTVILLDTTDLSYQKLIL